MHLSILLLALIDLSLGAFFNTIRTQDGDTKLFIVDLNDRYPVVFDTGGSDSWLKRSKAAAVEFNADGKTTQAISHSVTYSFGGNVDLPYAVRGTFWLGSIRWDQSMPIAESGTEDLPWHGILGASLGSAFTQTFLVFTTVPYADYYKVYVGGEQVAEAGTCYKLPLVEMGKRYGKWIVRGTIGVEESSRQILNFEVDTGFAPLSLLPRQWAAIKKHMTSRGAIYTGSEGQYQVFDNCTRDSLPSVFYSLGDGIFSVPVDGYANFLVGRRCRLDVVVHDLTGGRNFAYIGVPLLSSIIARFDAENESVSLCEVVQSRP